MFSAVIAKEISPNKCSEQAYIFRSYDHQDDEHFDPRLRLPPPLKNPGVAQNWPIWQVARSTSAAPRYFKPMVINGISYSDGGVLYNNPAELAYHEVLFKEGFYNKRSHRPKFPISLLLSVGTGLAPTKSDRLKNKFPKITDEKHFRKFKYLKERMKSELVNTTRQCLDEYAYKRKGVFSMARGGSRWRSST